MIFCMTISAPSSGDGTVLDSLIARIADGDREALAALYERTQPAVYGFALSILKNQTDAEDVLQDTYLRIWNAAGGYRSQGKPMAWVLSIVRNLALDRVNEQSRIQPVSEFEWTEQTAELPAVTQEDRLTLSTLLENLGEEERQIIMLHALTGFKHREIAELLKLPLPTVLSKYHRGIKKLKLAWEDDRDGKQGA